MGKTAFSGPVYGAKSLLLTFTGTASSGASSVVYAAAIVPAGQDWYLCESAAFRGSTGSTGFVAAVKDDSTVVISHALPSSVASASSLAYATASAGEYEGAKVAAGSTVTIEIASPTVASSQVAVSVYGYVRFVSSTRSE